MSEETSSVFQRKLAERRAREAERAEAARRETEDFSDVIPDDPYERSDADLELDRAVDGIDIIAAYVRWCGKMVPKVGKGQTESIMISCPVPGHADKEPSAWLNTDKQVWHCGKCQMGGDSHDLAAWHFGYPVPGYKEGATFHELRRKMAQDFGYTFHTAPGGVTYIEAPVEEDEPDPAPTPAVSTKPVVLTPEPTPGDTSPEADEISIVADNVFPMYDDGDMPQIVYPSLDWRAIVPEKTFLRTYMECTVIDDVTEEYHFWNGLLALGFALGRYARLYDLVPVHGNLFICTLGASGSGKSKARYHLDRLLDRALPHDWQEATSRGVRKISTPGSAEFMIHNFMKPVYDPANPKSVMYYASVTGLIDFNELSALIGRTNRAGNTLKPTLMQFYDMETKVTTGSMTTGEKVANEPFASALTTTQPAALRDLLGRSDDDSGFLNRWVFAAGPEKKRVAIGGVRVDMEPAVLPLQRILAWSGVFNSDEFVEWGPEAAAKFTDFFDNVIEPAKKRASSALITRVDLLMKKLILLLAANKLERVVSGATVDEAIAMYDYIIACYALPEAELGRTFAGEIGDAILHQAKRVMDTTGKGITLRELNRSLSRRNYPRDMLVKTLDQMCKLGELEIETTKPGAKGRPTTRYKYNAG